MSVPNIVKHSGSENSQNLGLKRGMVAWYNVFEYTLINFDFPSLFLVVGISCNEFDGYSVITCYFIYIASNRPNKPPRSVFHRNSWAIIDVFLDDNGIEWLNS